ncbi:hypothetical protein [Sphingorhabdus sp.]|uniref:hypothetical protein n=2 Tax=Sphingorhabdus sp. TaxID=1902408 RepID=UPI003BAFF2A3|nr:hypothetical protein [Sphingomonadales bacterium]MBK9432317.1 hypothetical protein [Sphingomonadales bacterium]MBL0022150.1 hypothetical protein [Sphingomonadales bacterium]
MRNSLGHAALAAVSVIVCGVAAHAAPKPMELAATYVESNPGELKLPKDAKPCSVSIASLVDERRSPEMIGVYFGRAIHAPVDRDAWLRSMIAALKSRKIAVNFAAAGGELQDSPPVDIAITKAWIANTESNMSASIVFRLKSTDATGVATEQSYRGGASHMSYWSGGPGELQRAFDTSVSRGLDAMAADIQKRCGNID